jgi:excisionase family DNA binding protein
MIFMADRSALFVRIPTEAAERLHRAAFELNTSKQDLVAGLVTHYVDPADLGSLRRITVETRDDALTVGHAELRPDPPAAVLTLEDAAALLQVAVEDVESLAETGELPGRKVGGEWRFARDAVLRWLAG